MKLEVVQFSIGRSAPLLKFMKRHKIEYEDVLAAYTHGQWITLVLRYDVLQINLDEDGLCLYYMSKLGAYGNPLFYAEPDMGIDLPERLNWVDRDGKPVNPDQKIAGIICRDEAGDVQHRFSLTNAAKQGVELLLSEGGSLLVDGETWYLEKLVEKDKNRLKGYDAYFVRTAPTSSDVPVLELADC